MARTPSVTKDPHALARIVTDSEHLGVERAAKKHGVCTKTVERYRKTAKGDPNVSALVAAKKKSIDDDWRNEAVSFLRSATQTLQRLCEGATQEQIREVAGAIKIVGELTVAKDVLGADVEQPGPDSARPAHEEAQAGSEADESVAPVH